ncbi:MAG: hypothetical protein V1734_03425 [Nanoarchaeota archaeon]
MGFFKKAGAVAGLTALLIGADMTCGGATCAEAYDRQNHAPPNGAPIQAAVSRYADHFDEMSPYAQLATLVPFAAAAGGIIVYAGRKSKKKEK